MVVSTGSRWTAGEAAQFQAFVALFHLDGDNTHNGNGALMLEKARELLNMGLKASRKEVRGAYRRAARRWHPDRAPAGLEETCRARIQRINAAYQLMVQSSED